MMRRKWPRRQDRAVPWQSECRKDGRVYGAIVIDVASTRRIKACILIRDERFRRPRTYVHVPPIQRNSGTSKMGNGVVETVPLLSAPFSFLPHSITPPLRCVTLDLIAHIPRNPANRLSHIRVVHVHALYHPDQVYSSAVRRAAAGITTSVSVGPLRALRRAFQVNVGDVGGPASCDY